MTTGSDEAGKLERNSASRTALPATWCAIRPTAVAAPVAAPGVRGDGSSAHRMQRRVSARVAARSGPRRPERARDGVALLRGSKPRSMEPLSACIEPPRSIRDLFTRRGPRVRPGSAPSVLGEMVDVLPRPECAAGLTRDEDPEIRQMVRVRVEAELGHAEDRRHASRLVGGFSRQSSRAEAPPRRSSSFSGAGARQPTIPSSTTAASRSLSAHFARSSKTNPPHPSASSRPKTGICSAASCECSEPGVALFTSAALRLVLHGLAERILRGAGCRLHGGWKPSCHVRLLREIALDGLSILAARSRRGEERDHRSGCRSTEKCGDDVPAAEAAVVFTHGWLPFRFLGMIPGFHLVYRSSGRGAHPRQAEPRATS